MGNTKREKTMKQKNNKPNSPRLANAIKKACAYARDHSGRYSSFGAYELGMLIFEFAYKADKYDVLNDVCPGVQREVVTYIRGDIRHRKRYWRELLLLFAVIIFSLIILANMSPC